MNSQKQLAKTKLAHIFHAHSQLRHSKHNNTASSSRAVKELFFTRHLLRKKTHKLTAKKSSRACCVTRKACSSKKLTGNMRNIYSTMKALVGRKSDAGCCTLVMAQMSWQNPSRFRISRNNVFPIQAVEWRPSAHDASRSQCVPIINK
jgi:hypothetical protein